MIPFNRLPTAIFKLCPLVVLLSSFATLFAEPIKSPLVTPLDSLGRELQQTFISAPANTPVQPCGSFAAYRKTFALSSKPQKAKLHIFADARYIVWINGQPTHRGPNRFDIFGPEYDTVDIAQSLRAGPNTIAIVVMSNDGVVSKINDSIGQGFNARMMEHATGLTLRIDADGKPLLKTDETWKWSDRTRYRGAKIEWAKIVDRVDTRVEDGDWSETDYNDRAWANASRISGDIWGPLSARRIPLLRDTSVKPRYSGNVSFPENLDAGQKLTFSMGRLVQAYTVITFEADEGTEFSLDYAGVQYAAEAGRQTYISSDSCAFAGGSITVKSGRVKILDLKLVERLYPFDVVGSFKSNDPLLNRLWAVCTRSLQILSEDAYVDCADRERAEWMDCDPPAFDVTRTATAVLEADGKYRYADARLLGEMLRRTALSQQKDGWVKAHTTSDRFDIHAKMEDRACDWVQGARRYYESTGDLGLIREIWPVILSQMDYFLNRRSPRGLVLAREWVVWGNPIGYVTCEGAGLNAFVYKALVDAAFLGNALGEFPQANRFSKAATDLAKAFNDVLWSYIDGTYYSGYYADEDQAKASGPARKMKLKVASNLIEPSMFSALWALDQEIVPPSRLKRVTDYMLRNRDQAQRTMTFYYLFTQMYAADNSDFDREILDTLRTKWKPQADSVWGTTWEDLDGASKAHCYGMFPSYFLSAYVLGVRPVLPASKRLILIEPHLGDLTSAEGIVVTEYGPVPVSWKSEVNKLHFRFEVPAGVNAVLRIPKNGSGGKLVLGSQTPVVREQEKFLETELKSGVFDGYFDLSQ